MSFNPNKLTFKTDEITGEIIQPKIFLCNRRLDKIGEIFPVNELRIKAVLNGADEISFSTPKYIKNYNDRDAAFLNRNAPLPVSNDKNPLYDRLNDYSVILAEGFGYFEVSPTVNNSVSSVKQLHGNSLGESELSQLYCTLECNTDEDITNFLKLHPSEKYIPSVLYCDNDRDHSLIHRILTYAPNYRVGTVDHTIQNVQRTFSFSNRDIISCFSEIAQEINCIFDVVVRRDDNGTAERTVNIYDAQYCRDCGKRNIINGVCRDCSGTNIAGVGEDTTICIGTDNLSDEITLTPDGNMKNCLIIEGGDDLVTNTVEGILPSAGKKIYLFSPDTSNSFSQELKEKYDEYVKGFNESRGRYAKLLEIEYEIFDLILYLQSGRMPTIETADTPEDATSCTKLQNEVKQILTKYHDYFPNGLGLTSTSDTTSKNGVVRQVFSLFVNNGYAVKQENGNYDASSHRWTGDLIIYELTNNSSKATLHVYDDCSNIEYSDTTDIDAISFYIEFSENYEIYLNQMVALRTKNYEFMEGTRTNQPKEWQKYSLNRLYSYESGYQLCVETLEEEKNKTNLPGVESAAKDLRDKYIKIISDISGYIARLEDMIYHLYSYYGNFDKTSSSAPSSQAIDYSSYKPRVFIKTEDAFRNMSHYIRYGTWVEGSVGSITDHPIYCADCSSSNVTLDGCNQCKSKNIITYSGLAQLVYEEYRQNNKSLESQRKWIRDRHNLKLSLGDDLYKELCSFIREDVYTNSNFVSDGLSNSELIRKAGELVEKAEQELAKSCISQHTLSGNVYSFAAYSRLPKEDFPISGVYDGFKLGNFMRYFSEDGKTYKLRLSSEEFSWTDSGAELNVEFTDVIQYLGGGVSDLASLMQTVGSLSTSFDSVKKQAGQGAEANLTFQRIKNEGLQSALSNVLNARDIDVQIDEHGITLRKYDYELDDYSPYQMKLINRNIVMTDDSWKNARMAIGLGRYGEGSDAKLVYGVWADLLVGNMLVGENLLIRNKDCTVEINESGIIIENGVITWDNVNKPEIENINGLANRLNIIDTNIEAAEDNAKEYTNGVNEELNTSLTNAYQAYANSAVAELDEAVANYLLPGSKTLVGESCVISPYIGGGYLNITGQSGGIQNQVIIDPKNMTDTGYIFAVRHGDDFTVGIKPDGTASFKGTVYATNGKFNGSIYSKSGTIGGWTISDKDLQSIKTDGFNDVPGEKRLQTMLLLDGDTCSITSSSLYNFVDRSSSQKYQYKTHLTDGEIKCMKSWIGENAKDIIKQSSLYLDGGRICLKHKTGNDSEKTFFDVSESSKTLRLNGDMNVNGTINQNNTPIGDLYCVVKTGEQQCNGTGTWENFTVDFGVTYKSRPFINVMPASTFDDGNIAFVGFGENDDDTNGYSQLKYAVYAKTIGKSYNTRWFAVGNIKQ